MAGMVRFQRQSGSRDPRQISEPTAQRQAVDSQASRGGASHPSAAFRLVAQAPGLLTSGHVQSLQRTIGNRAVGRILARRATATAAQAVIQRAPVDITRPQGRGGYFSGWSKKDEAFITDYQTIQRLLTNDSLFKPALEKLEEEVNEQIILDGKYPPSSASPGDLSPYVSYTNYLEYVLLRQEQKFGINVSLPRLTRLKAAPLYTKTLSGDVFGKLSQSALIPQDPGAYTSHGEFAHRLQWYVIFTYADRLKNTPRDLLMNITNPRYSPAKEAWPKGDALPPEVSIDEPTPEGSGTLWDALLDRQINEKRYQWNVEGITSPEMLTSLLLGDRSDADLSRGADWAAANLPTLATIIKARTAATRTAGDTATEHDKRANASGYTNYAEGVWVKGR